MVRSAPQLQGAHLSAILQEDEIHNSVIRHHFLNISRSSEKQLKSRQSTASVPLVYGFSQ